MSITNGYAILDQLKEQMRIPVNDLTDDARLELAIAAASRQTDGHTGRRFWQDATVKVREYSADDPTCLLVDDISTATGLIVQLDDNQDGVYETTLTINTDFRLYPWNAAAEVPAWPFTELRLAVHAGSYFPMVEGSPTVKVTARFGWPAVPDDVTKACLVQAGQLFKSDDAAFGAVQFAESGVALRVLNRLHPIAEALLEPFCKARVG